MTQESGLTEGSDHTDVPKLYLYMRLTRIIGRRGLNR